MYESEFEAIIGRYPDLIEEGLTLVGRQVNIKGKFIDLLFKDRHGQKLIIELKRGTILRGHVAQLMDYEGHLLSPDDPTVRVMLVGNRVPPNLRKSLDHHGFEWKEISESFLTEFLNKKGDQEFLKLFSEKDLEMKPTSKNRQIRPGQRSANMHTERRIFWETLLDKAEKNTDLNINFLMSKPNCSYGASGKTGLKWVFAIKKHEAWVELEVSISQNPEKTLQTYDKIFNDRKRIEKKYGDTLVWDKVEGRLACRIKSFSHIGGIEDTDKWDDLQNDLTDRMIRFEGALRDTIDNL